MEHSYEEIRAAALDVLAGREAAAREPTQYDNLATCVAEVFARREQPAEAMQGSRRPFQLSSSDGGLFLEVFWELFRQGVITLGMNDMNREFPFFRVSRLGKRLIENQDTYFFHDVASYTKWLKEEVPGVDPTTLIYVQESLQAFRSGCILSCTVMLGVATEHTFLNLLETATQSPTYGSSFAPVSKERSILPKINRFRKILEQHMKVIPSEVKEDLDTRFAGILSIIRNFRNDAGHPTGRVVDREQAYMLLQLFVPYCRKVYQLMEYLGR